MRSQYSAPYGLSISPGTADVHLITYVAENSFKRVFIVAGTRSFKWFLGRELVRRLSDVAEVLLWSGVRPNPEVGNLRKGLEEISKFHPDLIIGIGGGSALDLAKMLAALYAKPPLDLELLTCGEVELGARKLHLVLVPTTAGSGAEATHFSVLYQNHRKYSIAGGGLLPDQIFLDPALVTTGSKNQLAASGLDALCQCVESIWAIGATTESQDIAAEGLRLVSKSLVDFVNGDFHLAEKMQWGSHLGGHAINTSRTTAPHALSYFLTTELAVPHGIAVASTIGYFIDHHKSATRSSNTVRPEIAQTMERIIESLQITQETRAVKYFNDLFTQLGLNAPRSYWPQSSNLIGDWIRSANQERLANHPFVLNQNEIRHVLGVE